ncbi:hypothetical protein [Ruegeria sp. R14_0]|uniref:hypothetical protein n=1 Tax=Ruegeria sp. R14_0 TaxID=2821100 RepID=UPI001AD97B21|nr:hypothetical protein [Ruegeria sp. R14_0]MBO9444851.1 hypothetical protein [Ruegeria sp. R14_0]
MDDDLTYSGGLPALQDRFERRRAPFEWSDVDFPAADADLVPLTHQIVPESATRPDPGKADTSWTRKRQQIAREFVGKSELAFLNAQLISNLRKRAWPSHAPALFCRLWAEHSEHLLQQLDLRWQVSSIQTFADHGATQAQREVGSAMRMLFGIMKLYEFERLFSGRPPDVPYPLRRKADAELPMEMNSFSFEAGGLDINILTPVWAQAKTDQTIAPLADHLFTALNRDPGTVFRRLAKMREAREARRAARQ